MNKSDSSSRDSGVLSNPLSFLRSSRFLWSNAGLDGRGDLGLYWSLRSYSTTSSNFFYLDGAYLNPLNDYERGRGFAVRCDKSFTTLINTSYSMKNNSQTSEDNRDSGLLSSPLSFLRSGDFDWLSATLVDRGGGGSYWSLYSANTARSCYLAFGSTYLNPQNSYYRSLGLAVRCESNTQWSGGLAPDSICPKGWQLPTYEGDKSFDTLIKTGYSMKNDTSGDSGILSGPLSFLRSGSFSWSRADLNIRGSNGLYWSLRSISITSSNDLNFGSTYLNPLDYYNRGYGFAVRCKLHSSFLKLLKDFLKVFRRGH